MSTITRSISPLYCAYNGFALGAFLGGAMQSFAKPQYHALRRRVCDFLTEIDVECHWPARHEDYVAAYPSLSEALLAAVRLKSRRLYEYAGIGAMAALHAGSYSLTTPQIRRTLRVRWEPVLARHGVPSELMKKFQRELAKTAPSRNAVALFSAAFNLVPHLLEPLPNEADTCFVAMPFQEPFAGYFSSYYQPALRRAGFRAIRAWGGLAQEEYYPFIAPLLARCAAVFAELSTLNLNVINEIGLAHGANRPTFLVIGLHERRPVPSNLADLLILRYDQNKSGWPCSDVPRVTRYIRKTYRAYSESITAEHLVEESARQLAHYLAAAGRAVPIEVQQLAGRIPKSEKNHKSTQSTR